MAKAREGGDVSRCFWRSGILAEREGGRVSRGDKSAACFFHSATFHLRLLSSTRGSQDKRENPFFFSCKFSQVLPQRFLPMCFIYNFVQPRCAAARPAASSAVARCARVQLSVNAPEQRRGRKRMSALSLVLEYFYPRCVSL